MDYKTILYDQYQYVNNLPYKYIDSIRYYSSDGYDAINTALLLCLPMASKDSNVVRDLDSIFDKAPPIDRDITVYRGVSKKHPLGVLPGYISTSYDIQTALEFSDREQGCCMFVINIPKGSKILPIEEVSSNKREKEILLPRSTNFILTSNRTIGSMDYFYLTMGDRQAEVCIPVEKKETPPPTISKSEIITLLVDNTVKDDIDLFGVEEAVQMTASNLRQIAKLVISDEDIKAAIRLLKAS